MIQILFRTDKAILLKVRMGKEEDKGILQHAKCMGEKACHKNLRSTQRKLTDKKIPIHKKAVHKGSVQFSCVLMYMKIRVYMGQISGSHTASAHGYHATLGTTKFNLLWNLNFFKLQ